MRHPVRAATTARTGNQPQDKSQPVISAPHLVAYSLRPAEAGDAEFQFRLFAERLAQMFAITPYTREQLQPVFEQQHYARQAGYAQQFPGLEDHIILSETGEAVGELMVYPTPSNLRLADITIFKAHRGKGLGRTVLADLQQRAGRESRTVTLAVDLGSRARKLYDSLGFVETERNEIQAQMLWTPEGR